MSRRIDERDTMFARMAWTKDGEAYRDYYERYPERKITDDALRQMPELCSDAVPTFDPLYSRLADSTFRLLGDINPFSEGHPFGDKVPCDPKAITEKLKTLAHYFGADLVGMTALKPEHLYTYRGRREAVYGMPNTLDHTFAIAIAVEMDQDMIDKAPQAEEVMETSKAYLKVGMVGMALTYFIRELGYEARNHMDGNYLVIAPLVAQDAGLGELGRMSILLTKAYGPRVRLGVITTTLPLVPDEPLSLGVSSLCARCARCANVCPAGAIPKGSMPPEGWSINQDACFKQWRTFGTDCGICLSKCSARNGIPD